MHINARDLPPPLHFCFIIDTPRNDTLINEILPCKTCSSRLKNSLNHHSAAANIWRYREQTERFRAIHIFKNFETKKARIQIFS